MGWAANTNSAKLYDNQQSVKFSADITLYAVWKPIEYTISYIDCGTNAAGNPASYTINSGTITLAAPTKTGYTFAGWYEAADFNGSEITQIVGGSTGNKTFYAKWEEDAPVNYTVEHYQQTTSLGNNYELFETETLSAPTGSATQASAKTYAGFTSQSFSQATVSENGSTVVKIYYNRNTYTVTFEANGGTGTMTEQTFYYGVAQNLSANIFERASYSFEGWALVSSGKSVYSDKESISDVATDTTLYAVWFYGSVVTATTVSELDLTNLTDAYTIKVTGNITQSDLVALAEKIAKATADITLDLSQTNLTTISSTSDSKSIFASCTKLTEIILPETMTTIGSYAFYNCTGLKNITIPTSVKTIGKSAFSSSAITSIDIDGVETIETFAFYNCSALKSVMLENVETIETCAFSNCSALSYVSLVNVTTVGAYAFENCTNLSSVTIDAVTIERNAFSGCTVLSSVTIGKRVTAIENYYYTNSSTNKTTYYKVFEGCTALTSVTFLDTENWYYEFSSSFSPSLDVSNAATNASRLKNNIYGQYKWYKKTE